MANLVFDFLHHYVTGERRASDPADAYQYDEGHVMEAVVPVAVTSCEIHYWVRGQEESEAYVPESITQNEDGSYSIIGHIPNTYFETYGELRVYIVVTDGTASITTYEGRIHICERSKPDDYVDDDPENEATRVLNEAREAAATATAAAETCEEVLESIPADYSQLSDDVDDLKDGLNIVSEGLDDEIARAQAEEARIEALFTQPVEEAVSDWLDAHPEATTTVQDGALTEQKFSNALKLKAIKDYVTPEMFGAMGDGTSDDTDALQAAIDSNKPVLLTKKTYAISQITLRERSNIMGFGKASVIKSSLTDNSYAITSEVNVHDVVLKDFVIVGNNTNSGIILIGNDSTSGDSRNIISNVIISNVYNGIEIQRNHREFIIQNCMVTNAANDGFVIPTSDGKIINCTAGMSKHIGYNLKNSSLIQMTNCKDFLCGADSGSDGFGVACGILTSISGHISQASYYSAFNVGYYCKIDATIYSCNYANDDSITSYFLANVGGFNQINVVIQDGYYQYADYLLEFVNADKTIFNTINISLSAADISTHAPILPTTPVCNNLDGLNGNLKNTLVVNGITYAETLTTDTVPVADYATANGSYTFRSDYLTDINKRDGIISVALGIVCGSAVTSGDIIGTVSPEYRPINAMYFPAVKLWSADGNAIVGIDTYGVMRMYGHVASGTYVIYVTYFTAK